MVALLVGIAFNIYATSARGAAADGIEKEARTMDWRTPSNGSAGPIIGAVPNSTQDTPYYSFGGVERYTYRQLMTATSSGICVQKNPWNATSTLEGFDAYLASSSATGLGIANLLFDLSTTSTLGGYGSSSPAFIKAHVLVAGTLDQVTWSPMLFGSTTVLSNALFSDKGLGNASGTTPFFVKPGDYVTYRIASGTPGTFGTYFQGYCDWSFRKM